MNLERTRLHVPPTGKQRTAPALSARRRPCREIRTVATYLSETAPATHFAMTSAEEIRKEKFSFGRGLAGDITLMKTTYPRALAHRNSFRADRGITCPSANSSINQPAAMRWFGRARGVGPSEDPVGAGVPATTADVALPATRRQAAMRNILARLRGIACVFRASVHNLLVRQRSEKFIPVSRRLQMEGPCEQLSDREMEVFALIGDGHSTWQIALRLNLSIRTIDSYCDRLQRKLRPFC